MNRRRLLVSFVSSTILALAAAAPVAAAPSCVGWFASTFAREDPRGFSEEIRFGAHELRPFGGTTVAPFAHIALEDCQGE
jgi:hypothetical protein